MSISGRKKVFDMQGVHLFSIVRERIHIHETYAVESADKKKIMEVKSSFKRKCAVLHSAQIRSYWYLKVLFFTNFPSLPSGRQQSYCHIHISKWACRVPDNAGELV